MRFCLKHWDELQHQTAAMGMWGMVTHGGAQDGMITAIAKVPDRVPHSELTDPLMSAAISILDKAHEQGGSYLLWGDLCPLCEMESHTSSKSKDWIGPCMEAVKENFVERGIYRESQVQ